MTMNPIDEPSLGRRTYGVPMFRSGDNCYLIGNMPPFHDYVRQMELSELSLGEYRCPFDFLKEFDQWFEWQRRVHFEKQSTGWIITTMLSDIDRIKAHRVELTPKFYCDFNYSSLRFGIKSLIATTSI